MRTWAQNQPHLQLGTPVAQCGRGIDPVWTLHDAVPSFQACGLSPHVVSPVTLLVFSPGCPSGTFKANQGDEACTHCPINSRTTSEGATNCVCRNGYYRADLDPLDMPCTSTSRAPEGRHLTESRGHPLKSSERGLGGSLAIVS